MKRIQIQIHPFLVVSKIKHYWIFVLYFEYFTFDKNVDQKYGSRPGN
jgi:hypothetical protein